MRFDARNVLRAVKSLYDDELKPAEHAILRRLRELRARAAALANGLPVDAVDPETMPQVDPQRLRGVCQGMRQLRVVAEEDRGYSVRLLGRPDCFVDVSADADVYPPELWTELAAHLEAAEEAGLRFPGGGGPYGCARALAAQSLPCLRGLSLGRVCQVVHVAISQKRLLGYLHGSLVPLRPSVGCPEDRRAPSAGHPAGRRGLSVASLDQVRAGMRQPLHRHAEGAPLSDVRTPCRSPVGLDLEERALRQGGLGCLLGGPWLRDRCQVEAGVLACAPSGAPLLAGDVAPGQGRPCARGALELPRAVPSPRSGSRRPRTRPGTPSPRPCASGEDGPGEDAVVPQGALSPAGAAASSVGSCDVGPDLCTAAEVAWRVKNTFVHVGEDDGHSDDEGLCVRRAKSLPPCSPASPHTRTPGAGPLGEGGPEAEAGVRALALPGAALCLGQRGRAAYGPDSRGSGADCGGERAASPASTAATSAGSRSFSSESIEASEAAWCVKNTFVHVSDDDEQTDDEGLGVRPTRSLPPSFQIGLF